MRYLLISIFLFIVHCNQLLAQCDEASNWYFGFGAGITFCNPFSSQSPVPLSTSMVNTLEGIATISDSFGNLLFYTDGIEVWTANHMHMPNCLPASPGGQLMGNPSSSQSGVIVPKPFDPNTYYIFAVDDINGMNGMTYSRVDMTANGGLGDIDATEKNITLINPSCEKIAVTHHANGMDYWVLGHSWNSNSFYAFLVTSAGVELTNPVISNIGTPITGASGNKRGYLRFSPDGSILAQAVTADSYFELFDFDSSLGILSGHRLLNSPANGAYGIEFSPSGGLLYGTCWYNNSNQIYQWDINSPNQSIINNSIQAVGTVYAPTGPGAMQLGPDGMIYVAKYGSFDLGRIQYPDLSSSACSYEDTAVTLNGICGLGLPTFISSFFTADLTYNPACFDDPWEFYIVDTLNLDSAMWNFGDPGTGVNNSASGFNAWHNFSSPGSYMIDLTIFIDTLEHHFYETVNVLAHVELLPLNDSIICLGDSVNISIPFASSNIIWSTGDTTFNTSISPLDSTMIYVDALFSGCLYSDSMLVIPIEIESDFTAEFPHCYGDTITLNYTGTVPNGYIPQFGWDIGFATYIQGNSSTPNQVQINSLIPGPYPVSLYLSYPGCQSSLTEVIVDFPAEAQIDFQPTLPLCFGDSTGSLEVLVNGSNQNALINWSTGDTSYFIDQIPHGLYSLTVVYNDACKMNTSFFLDHPALLEAGNVSTQVLCYGDGSGTIQVIPSGGTGMYFYNWSNNETASYVNNLTSGVYTVTVNDANACSTILTETILEPPPLELEITQDTVVCSGDTIMLQAFANGGTTPYEYIWTGIDTSNWISMIPMYDTTIQIFVLDGNDCESLVESVFIHINPSLAINPLVNVPDSICPMDELIILAEAIGGIGYGYSYFVNNELVIMPHSVFPGSSMILELQIMDACHSYSNTEYIPVNVIESPENPLDMDKYAGCEPFVLLLDDHNTEIGSNLEWFIEKHDGVQFSNQDYPVVTWEYPGEYSLKLIVYNTLGCDFTSEYRGNVVVYPKPEADFISDQISVSALDPIIFFENLSPGQGNAVWNFGDGATLENNEQFVSHTYQSPNNYNVELVFTSNEGCIDSAYKEILVYEIGEFYAPNALAPFSIVGNNTFMPFIYPEPVSIHLLIFDRWGSVIFETFDYKHQWDARNSNGELIKQDVFTWLIEYKDSSDVSRIEHGVITVVY
jgi:PKD repeat protein